MSGPSMITEDKSLQEASMTTLRGSKLCRICKLSEPEDVIIVSNVLSAVLEQDRNMDGLMNEISLGFMNRNYLNWAQSSLIHLDKDILKECFNNQAFIEIITNIFRNKYGEDVKLSFCSHEYLISFFVRLTEEVNKKANGEIVVISADEKLNIKNRLMERLSTLASYIKGLRTEMHNLIDMIHNIPDNLRGLIEERYHVSSPWAYHGERVISEEEDNSPFSTDVRRRPSFEDSPVKKGHFEHDEGSMEDEYSSNSSSLESLFNKKEASRKLTQAQALKNKLPKKATEILKSWFLQNIDNPYPNSDVKEYLAQASGLDKKQIQNWFTNSRKRYLEPLKRRMKDAVETKRTGVPTAMTPSKPLEEAMPKENGNIVHRTPERKLCKTESEPQSFNQDPHPMNEVAHSIPVTIAPTNHIVLPSFHQVFSNVNQNQGQHTPSSPMHMIQPPHFTHSTNSGRPGSICNDASMNHHGSTGFTLHNRQELNNASRMVNNDMIRYPFGLLNNELMGNQLRRASMMPQLYQGPPMANPALLQLFGNPWGMMSPRNSASGQLFGMNPFLPHLMNQNLLQQGRNSTVQGQRHETFPKMEERHH